ncbi:EAL domain-containing protein [Vibrio sp. DW001]|uniref:sensor domain-containing protein n=1 Tax=Vibrio sp. DW001 TaxID=2912315 RepID=UPI0023AE7B28|nr:GGDEF domain-containing phosphodiesterase [Vibrio sp. DW001]WED25271.1 EAL domain-containing protein [Vibrio sp. DW001]
MKYKKDIDPLANSQLFDVLQQGFLAPSTLPSVALELERIGITADKNSTLFFSIVNQSSNAVVITDVDKNIIYVNKKFEQLSGYSLEDVIGENPRVLKSSQTSSDTYRDMHLTLQAGNQWRGVFINVHRNGNQYIEEAVISPILNDKGSVICFLAEKKDITAQKYAEDRVKKLTQFDSLTELPNRAFFIEEAEFLASVKPTVDNHFSILFADIDRFKELNDTHGHLCGDGALKTVARRLTTLLSANDFLARVDGDEFVIIHRNATENSTSTLAKKLIASFSEPIGIQGREHYLGVSIGSSTWPIDGHNLDEILSRADLAMHRAKSTQQSYASYTRTLGYEHDRAKTLSVKLAKAIENAQFFLVYQPKIDLSTKRVTGLEALLRWNEPELGFIGPIEFIPIAEKHGLITDIGHWVIVNACKQINEWHAEGLKFEGRISINISVQQIEQPNFYERTLATMNSEQISPTQIELEVTESILIKNPEKIMAILGRLVEAGFSIAIDDFGTGYSSFTYLKKLKASVLKIDRSFVANVTSNRQDQSIVQSINHLGHNLGLTVIAEGVETIEQSDYLASIGCDMVQGFYYSKPLPAKGVVPFIEDNQNRI